MTVEFKSCDRISINRASSGHQENGWWKKWSSIRCLNALIRYCCAIKCPKRNGKNNLEKLDRRSILEI